MMRPSKGNIESTNGQRRLLACDMRLAAAISLLHLANDDEWDDEWFVRQLREC